MTETMQYFIEILRAFVQETVPALPKNIEWKEFFYLSRIHSVTGITGYMLKKLPQGSVPENEYTDRLLKSCNGTIINFASRGVAMTWLEQKYNSIGIPCVPMKGYIVRNFYPVPELRTYGDIDFLIKKEDRKKSHTFMIENGYMCCDKSENVWTYKSKNGHEVYEIHTKLLGRSFNNNESSVQYAESAWEHVTYVPEEGCYRFNEEFHIIYILLHLAAHFAASGAGARMFMDVALIMKKASNLNWSEVADEMEKMCLSEFLGMILSLCEKWFGVLPPFEFDITADTTMDTAIQDEISEYIISGGTFGAKNVDGITLKLKRAHKSSGNTSVRKMKMVAIFREFFPGYAFMRSRYSALRKAPFLLPIFWIVRLITSVIIRKGKGLQKIKQFTRRDIDKADRSYRMTEVMGLTSKK